MRILVIGKNGQLGKSFQKQITKKRSTHHFNFVGTDELDLTSLDNIYSYFNHNIFDIIINCGAYTAVDNAEKEPKLANQVNHLAVAELAKISKLKRCKLIHISTDYVFDGKTNDPYMESEPTNPINVYGKTKLAGERAILNTMEENGLIIRTSWLYSVYGNNFVNSMITMGPKSKALNIVSDQIGSPTYAIDLVDVILKITNTEKFISHNILTEVFHFSNIGTISWDKFAKEIFKIKKINCKINPISLKEYKSLARRPKNTSMNKDKIKSAYGIDLIFWKDSLKRCLES